MLENYEHYISKNIKAYYRKRLLPPIIYLLILGILWFIFPLNDMLFPKILDSSSTIETSYNENVRYCQVKLNDLRFTGYTREFMGNTNGYFYYCMRNGECIIVLLSPSLCEEGLPSIDSITFSARLMEGGKTYQTLLTQLASDLEWTETGITSQLSNYYISEPNFNSLTTLFLFVTYLGTMAFAAASLIIYIIYIQFPVLSPCCSNLVVFGSPKKMLEEAEEELATLPQLATEDMFITEHYFILTSPSANAIIPIRKILWIYKHSTLHKFLWYHFSISYTLHISADKHLYLQCPKNTKSDIDGIIDYLAEANHKILVGFNEENRLKIQEVQGKPLHIEKIYAMLRRKL